jgi:hypothetical protein
MTFSFGQSQQERIDIEVIGYEREPVGEYIEDNWLTIEIRVQAGEFSAKVKTAVLTEELVKFSADLQVLFHTQKGSATLKTLGAQLGLRLEAVGIGHVQLFGEVEAGHRLIFTLLFDQSLLGLSIRELEEVIVLFPVR